MFSMIWKEKKVFNEFFKVRFVNRDQPKVYIQEHDDCNMDHCFLVSHLTKRKFFQQIYFQLK